MPLNPQAFIFDAYGTLFDVHSVVRRDSANIPGFIATLAAEATRIHLVARPHGALREDFWHITEAALRAAVGQLSIKATDEQMDHLMQAYLFPAAFAETRSALDGLKGSPLAILSNGSPGMLEWAIRNNSLESYFAEVISVDRVKTYEPSPRVYELGSKILHLPAREILFVSSNAWDAAGAKAFGYLVCWCNRSGAEEEDWGFSP